jgi:hypothetical protein
MQVTRQNNSLNYQHLKQAIISHEDLLDIQRVKYTKK